MSDRRVMFLGAAAAVLVAAGFAFLLGGGGVSGSLFERLRRKRARHLVTRRFRRSDRLARILTDRELAYLSRAIFRQRVDRPDDEAALAAQLDPLVSVARMRTKRG